MINALFRTSQTTPPRMSTGRVIGKIWTWIRNFFSSPNAAKADQVAQNTLKAQRQYNSVLRLSLEETKERNTFVINCKKLLKDLKISNSYLFLPLGVWKLLNQEQRKEDHSDIKSEIAKLIENELKTKPENSESFTILKNALEQFKKGIFTSPYDRSKAILPEENSDSSSEILTIAHPIDQPVEVASDTISDASTTVQQIDHLPLEAVSDSKSQSKTLQIDFSHKEDRETSNFFKKTIRWVQTFVPESLESEIQRVHKSTFNPKFQNWVDSSSVNIDILSKSERKEYLSSSYGKRTDFSPAFLELIWKCCRGENIDPDYNDLTYIVSLLPYKKQIEEFSIEIDTHFNRKNGLFSDECKQERRNLLIRCLEALENTLNRDLDVKLRENRAKYESSVDPRIAHLAYSLSFERRTFGNLHHESAREARNILTAVYNDNAKRVKPRNPRVVTLSLPKGEEAHRPYDSYKMIK